MRLSPQTSDLLRRLHSLSGVVPVGLFLLEHLWTNAAVLRGPRAFAATAGALEALPFRTQIELFVIALPILFHLVLGILIATEDQPSEGRRHYASDAAHLAQRVTGVFVAYFVVWHVWATRLSPAGLAPDADLFALMARQLAHPGTLALYVLGVVAVAAHFGNGLFAFSVRWGLARERGPRRAAGAIAWAVFVALALVGTASLLAFRGRGSEPVGRAPGARGAAVAAATPRRGATVTDARAFERSARPRDGRATRRSA